MFKKDTSKLFKKKMFKECVENSAKNPKNFNEIRCGKFSVGSNF